MFNFMQRCAVVLTLFICSPDAVSAADFAYDHNGSAMRIQVDGNAVRIYYTRPRSGLASVGVRAGTLLFDGTVSGGILEGMSRLFNSNCGEVDYFVYGDFSAGRSFKLSGAAPVLSNVSCRIVDNVYTGSNANLVFIASGDGGAAQPQPAGSGCVTGVNSDLNLRVGPSVSHGWIYRIPANTCGVRVTDTCRDGWCYVRSGRMSGWASMRYIRR